MTAAVASTLFAAAWKGTLLVAFALVVHRVARNRIPSRWLCALLLVAIVRLLVPVAPAASFSVFNLFPASTPASAPVILLDDAPPLPAAARTAMRFEAPAPAPPVWTPVLLGVWAFGALFALARVVLQTRRFHVALRDRESVDLGPLLDECRAALGLRRGVRVAMTHAVTTPSLHGLFRPTLLLPHRFLESFSREQLRYVVLHELAHLRRADVLVSWLATAASVLHWFNPLVRLAVARLAEERELACDALALSALRAEERPAYGGTVLEIAERTTQFVPALVGMTATPQQLKRRIVMIASFRRQSRSSIFFAAAVAVVALMTLTDASAGEPMRVRHFEKLELGAAAQEHLVRLEQRVSLELRNATVQDVLNSIANATGVTATVADDAKVDARVNLKAENVPAHLVLMETLGQLKLAAKFTEAGIEIQKEPEHVRIDAAPGQDRVFFIRRANEPHHPPAAINVEPSQKRMQIDGIIEDGKVKVTLQSADGAPAGKLEIELVK